MTFEAWSRMTFARCFIWILGISLIMTENAVFRSDSIFFKKCRKPRVEALNRSEIECLGLTERPFDCLFFIFLSFLEIKLY